MEKQTDKKRKSRDNAAKIKSNLPIYSGDEKLFHVWKMEFTSFLNLHRIDHYLTLPTDPPEAPSELTEDSTDERKEWERDSKDFYSILQLSLDPANKRDMVNMLKDKMNGAKAWENLCTTFRSKSNLRQIRLESQLSKIRMLKGENPVEFISRFQEINNEIERIQGENVSDAKLISQITKKLTPEYRSFIIGQAVHPTTSMIQLQEQLSEIHEYLQEEEQVNEVSLPVEEAHYIRPTSSWRGNPSQSRFYGRGRGYNQRPQASQGAFKGNCHHCGAPGHRKFECQKRKDEIAKYILEIDKKAQSHFTEMSLENKSNTDEFQNYKNFQSKQDSVRDDWILDENIARRHFEALAVLPSFDLCATQRSTKAPRFYSKQDNALSKRWSTQETYYMNPPFAMMNDFVIKAKKEEIHGVCVFPMWSEEKWFEELLAASTSQIILMPPLRQNIFVNPAIGWVNPRRIPTWEVGIVTFNFNTKSVTKNERKSIENSEEDEKWSKKLQQTCVRLLERKQHHKIRENQEKEKECYVIEEESHQTQTTTSYLVDSGTTNLMTSDVSVFNSSYKPSEQHTQVTFGNGSTLNTAGSGLARLLVKDYLGKPTLIQTHNALHVPELRRNLVSVSNLVQGGAEVHFTPTANYIQTKDTRVPIHQNGNLYEIKVLNTMQQLETNYSTPTTESLNLHERCGHPGRDNTRAINKNLGSNTLRHIKNCETCLQTKSKRQPFHRLPKEKQPSRPLQRAHIDISGRFNITGWDNETCFEVVVDQFSGIIEARPLQSESQAEKGLNSFITSFGKPESIRSDGAKSFDPKSTLGTLCRSLGIRQEFTNAYTSQQNGVAERAIGTITQIARSLLIQRNTPTYFWPFAIKTASYLHNRLPKATKKGNIPLSTIKGEENSTIDLSKWKTFGCLCYAHLRTAARDHKKLDKTSQKGIFLGYPDNQSGYQVYLIDQNKVITTRDVTFVEKEPGVLHMSAEDQLHAKSKPVFGYQQIDEDYQPENPIEPELEISAPFPCIHTNDDSSEDEMEDDHDTESDTDSDNNPGDNHPEQPTNEDPPSPPTHPPPPPIPSTTTRYPTRERNKPKPFWIANTESHYTQTDPKTVRQALKGPEHDEWSKAMSDEMNSLELNNTWEEVDNIPSGRQTISTKWVFKTKTDEQGKLQRHKARLVARGFSQTPGIDFTETFAPVTRMSTIRMLCAIAALRGYSLKQMDAKTAYLNAPLKEDLYIDLPDGYNPKLPNTNALRLKKALYGLKQAGREWNQLLTTFLKSSDKWSQCEYEPCLFKSKPKFNQGAFYMAVFVDDFSCAVEKEEDWVSFITDFKTHFQLSESDIMKWLLGIHVNQDLEKGTVTLCQRKYVQQMLDDFNMSDCNPTTTPITPDPPVKPTAEPTAEEQEWIKHTPYQGLVGSLIYSSRCTRPDTTFAVHHSAKFNSDYRREHWKSAKRVLSYLKGTSTTALQYSRDGEATLVGYADADWAADKNDRKSVFGYIFMLAGSAIAWKTKKQESVALSTCEAEYYAMSEAAQEATYLRRILNFLQVNISQPTTIYIDNRSAIALAKNPTQHTRAKHIDIKFHYNREVQEKGIVIFTPIASADNLADILTKPTSRQHLEKFKKSVGMIEVQKVEGECESINLLHTLATHY